MNIIHIYNEEFTGFIRITVIGVDRKNFFSDIVGCISSEGYNILSAKVNSTDDGMALDIFHLEPDTVTNIDIEKRKQNILKKMDFSTVR